MGIPHWVFLSIVSLLIARWVRNYMQGRWLDGFVSAFCALVWLYALWFSGWSQISGYTSGKVAGLAIVGELNTSEWDELAWRWAAELAVISAGEAIGERILKHNDDHRFRNGSAAKSTSQRANSPETSGWYSIALYLVVTGFIFQLLSPPSDLQQRVGDDGFLVLLRSGLVTGVAILIAFRHFGRGWLVGVSIGAAIFLALQGVRSPLALLLVAFLVTRLSDANLQLAGQRKRTLLRAAVLTAVASIAFSIISALRGNFIRDSGLSTREIVLDNVTEPLISPLTGGLDTLDGYRLSQSLMSIVPAHPWDMFKIVTTFVPRQIWSAKPGWLGVEISQNYLNYRSSAIFLSPTGYLSLVAGQWPLALLLFLTLSCLLALALHRFSGIIFRTFAIYGLFRFAIGGEAFDIYYVAALMLPVGAVAAALRWRLIPRLPGRSPVLTPRDKAGASVSH